MAIPLKYNFRSLFVRKVSNSMTGLGIALVVGIFTTVMAMVTGLDAMIRDTSSPDNLILLRRGTSTETGSAITLDQFEALKFLPEISRDKRGDPLVSPELSEDLFLNASDGSLSTLGVRGVLPVAMDVHDNVRIVSGRMFTPGQNEVIIGKALVDRYSGFSLGSSVPLGRRTWQIVGVFEAGGSSFESELWGDVHSLQEDSNRGAVFNSVRLKLAHDADYKALAQRLASDSRINLDTQTETEYYRDQAAFVAQVRLLGLFVAGVMAFGAIFAAMNTMYAAVSVRTAEIGTLRALGFPPASVVTSFLVESTALAVFAGLVGILLALPLGQYSTTLNTGPASPTLAFNFHITLAVVAEALMFAALIGLAGGWLPARQAVKMSVVAALKRT
jgi:putative ABC transport system permease protein